MNEEQRYQILEDVVYFGEGEPFWKLDLALPVNSGDQLRPAILLVHGGGIRGMYETGSVQSHLLRFLAGHGYVAASVEYRLSPIAPFPSQFVDVRRALQFLRGHAVEYRIDPERMGAVGHSAGACLVSMLGLIPNDEWLDVKTPYSQYSGTVQAVVSLSGLYSFEALVDDNDPEHLSRMGALIPGRMGTSMIRFQDASPMTYVGKHEASFLLVHGDKDDICPIAQSETFFARLKEENYEDVVLKVFPGVNHDTFLLPDLPGVIVEFFDERLKKKNLIRDEELSQQGK